MNVAKGVGITDIKSSMNKLGSFNNGLAEIDKLCARNGYSDLLKAERMANDVYNRGLTVYAENIDEWIKIFQDDVLSPLCVQKQSIENGGKGSGEAIGFVVYWVALFPGVFVGVIVGFLLGISDMGFAALVACIIAIPAGIITSKIIKNRALADIKGKIKAKEGVIMRLSNLKKK